MKNRFAAILLLVMLFGSAAAQEFSFPELKGFKKNTDFSVFTPENLWDFINGAAETYLAYGFLDLHIAEYKQGKNTIKLEVYHHSDKLLAFGIYSTERSSSFRFMNIGSQGYITEGSLNFFKGNYYVKLRTFSKSEKTLSAEQSLAMRVADMLGGPSEMPPMLSVFPETGKRINEEGYINESVLGHKFLNQAYKATYEVGPDVFSIFIIESKSPAETWKSAEAYLKATGMDALESESGKYVLTDGYNGTIFLSWKENRIVIISGLSKDQSDIADQYTSEILR